MAGYDDRTGKSGGSGMGHTPEQRVAASTRNGNSSASVWPSPRQTPGPPGPPCPCSSNRTPPDATMKRVGAPSAHGPALTLVKGEENGFKWNDVLVTW